MKIRWLGGVEKDRDEWRCLPRRGYTIWGVLGSQGGHQGHKRASHGWLSFSEDE